MKFIHYARVVNRRFKAIVLVDFMDLEEMYAPDELSMPSAVAYIASSGQPLGLCSEIREYSFRNWQTTLPNGWYKALGDKSKAMYDQGRISALTMVGRKCPGDGRLVFPNGYGGEVEHWVDNHDGSYSLHVEYHPGPADLRFVAECDRDYLNTLLWGLERRILPNVFPNTTILRDTEPGVWLLWLRANCPPDIGTWYMAQLELPNIQEIVEAANKECQDCSGAQKTQYENSAREAHAKAVRTTEAEMFGNQQEPEAPAPTP